MLVQWDGLSFDLPALTDESVLTFVDASDAPSLSVTVTKEPLAGGKPALLRYVDAQLAHIQRAALGYTVTSQGERAVGPPAGRSPAIHVQATINALGSKRVQHQLYVLAGDRVVVVAITADATRETAALAALAQVASSLCELTGPEITRTP